MEELFLEKDWGKALIRLDVTDRLLYGLFFAHLDDAAIDAGAGSYSLFAQHQASWFKDQRKWVDALYKAWAADPETGAANKAAAREHHGAGPRGGAHRASPPSPPAPTSSSVRVRRERRLHRHHDPRRRRGADRLTGKDVTMSTAAATRPVGVDIQESETNRSLVEAIELTNADCTVKHMPGLVRITAPGRLVVTRESVEERLGREWETHEFQLAIVSYFGHIKEWDDDEIVIAWDH